MLNAKAKKIITASFIHTFIPYVFFLYLDLLLSCRTLQVRGFFLLRKRRRFSASSPQQIFPKKSIFPHEIKFPYVDTKYCYAI